MPFTHKVFGPPGTGKTTRLLDLFEQEVNSFGPSRVAFLTFTRAAHAEALSRARRPAAELPWVRTLHSACFQALRLAAGRIVTAEALRAFGREAGLPVSGVPPAPWEEELFGWSERRTRADRLLSFDHYRRHRGWNAAGAALRLPPEARSAREWRWFAASYAAWKRREGLLDYTDLLERCLVDGVFSAGLAPRAVFVDEAQDLSRLQWAVVARLADPAVRVYAAGDDDQAIFTWAGADPAEFLGWPAGEEEVLPRSYRLPRAVWAQANKIAARISRRRVKEFKPRPERGEVHHAQEVPSLVPSERTFVLFRNHRWAADLAEQLTGRAVPFTGPRSPLSPAVRGALRTWRELSAGRLAPAADVRKMLAFGAWPPAELAGAFAGAEQAFGHAVAPDGWPAVLTRLPQLALLRSLEVNWGFDALVDPLVELLSIHQAKGREADHVVISTDLTPRTYAAAAADPDAEHRVFYVAVTRARRAVTWLAANGPRAYEP